MAAAPLAPVVVIERTRRGEPVDADSVEAFARSWLAGDSADALMSAWCMCACLREPPPAHAEALARALIGAGERLELASLGPTGDVGGTGAVGDTTPLVAAPLAAALGVRVATMAGRETTDKLRAIPGYDPDPPLGRFVRLVREEGIAVVGLSERLAVGERRLEALREATGTGGSAAVAAAMLMATRVSGGAGALSLLVGQGDGGPVAGPEEAAVATAVIAGVAVPWGRRVRWTVIDAGRPLGRAIGTALEVAEAAEVLRGAGPDDVRELAVRLAGDLAEAAGVARAGEGRARAEAALRDGSALRTAERWIERQGGDPEVWTDPGALPVAPLRVDVEAPRGGWVHGISARAMGEAARWVGAGRLHPMQAIDPVAGLEVLVSVGERVEEGQPMAVVHARDEAGVVRGRDMAATAMELGDEPAEPRPLVRAEGGAGA